MTLLACSAGLLVLLVLSLPIAVRVQAALGDEELWGVAELRWAFGLLLLRLASSGNSGVFLCGQRVARFKTEKRTKKRACQDSKSTTETGQRVVSKVSSLVAGKGAVADGKQRRAIFRMLQQAVDALDPRIYVGGQIGFGEAPSKAFALSVANGLDALLPDRVHLEFYSDFVEPTSQFHAHGRLRAVPAQLLMLGIYWLCFADTRRVLRGK